MKQRIYTDKQAALSFSEQVLTFNGEALIFWVKGLTHFDVNAFTYTEAEMGAAQISLDMEVEPSIEPAFDRNWYVDFRGERYFLSTLTPSAKKDTSSLKYTYSLIFKSQRADLERYEFANFVTAGSVQQPVSYDFTLPLTVAGFVERMNINLDYYFGAGVWQMVLDASYLDNLNTAIYDGTSTVTVAFSRETLWSLLTGLYDIYGLRWRISNEAGIMTIRLGYTPTILQHTFEYGKDKGLVSVERVNLNPTVYTRLSGRGSDRNLPYRYFDSSTSKYPEDPDNNEFTRDVPYSALMPKSYRDYVQGWNDASTSTPPQLETYAYNKGYTDTVFNPVDYVIDEAAESIYGIRKGSVADATDIYPTMQNVSIAGLGRIDEIVAVEAVLNDDIEGIDANLSQVVADAEQNQRTFQFSESVNTGSNALRSSSFVTTADYNTVSLTVSGTIEPTQPTFNYKIQLKADLMSGVNVIASVDSSQQSSSLLSFSKYVEFHDIAPGTYTIRLTGTLTSYTLYGAPARPNTITFETSNVTRHYTNQYKPTFDVWIKNIFESSQNIGESDDAYMHRIWDPLITPNKDLSVYFSTGLIAGEDYEFKVAKTTGTNNFWIARDTTKSISGVPSEWRLSLLKSDANLDATGLMLPNTTINASAGDYFFFTNIELAHTPYVTNAELRVQEFLEKELLKVNNENPTYAIKPSSVFLATYAENSSIQIGAKVPIFDERIIGAIAANLSITNLTIEYKAGQMLPEWNITVAEKPTGAKSSVQILQGDVKVLSSSLSSAREIAEQVSLKLDGRYLRKDGQPQTTLSKTNFADEVTTEGVVRSSEYLAGQLGGYGYSIFKGLNNEYTLEIDNLNVRKVLNVNELVINQVSAFGGKYIYSAAAMEVARVSLGISDDTCYIDSKGGSILNQFVVGDHAFCQRFDPMTQAQSKYYWRVVTEVGLDYIKISRTGGSGGTDRPAVGDVIAQLGHDASIGRQGALIIDQLNGGTVTQYAKIDGYTLANKDYVSYGVDANTGRAYERIYGDMYVGGRDQETDNYISFDSSTGLIDFRGTIRQESSVVDSGGNAIGSLLIDRGAYSGSAVYYPGNTVYDSGSTYRCILQTTPGIPTSNTTHWAVSAAKGETGANGSTGATGASGLNSATVYLYQRAATPPSTPSSPLAYIFSTGVLLGTLGAWTREIPDQNGYPCYVTTAMAISTSASAFISSTDWSPVRTLVSDGIDGADGADGADGLPAVQLYSPDMSSTVSPSSDAFSKQIRVRLIAGNQVVPYAEVSSFSTTLNGLTASSDTHDATDYIINLTAFSSNTTTVGYINVSAVYLGNTYTISISVARVVNPVLVIKGTYQAGAAYYGNCNQRDAVYYSGGWYAAKITLGSTSTTWVPAEWEALNTFSNVATDTLLAANANLGGLIFKDEQLISQSGTIGGNASTNWSDAGFVPNLLIDGSTGQIIANSATIRGHIEANSGSIGNLDVSAGGLAYNSAGELMSLDERNIEFSADDSSNRVVVGTNITDGGLTILGHPVALMQNNGLDPINRGIYLDVSSGYGYHQALYGNGNIGMNGAVVGYGHTQMIGYESGQVYQMSMLGGNHFAIFASVANTAFIFPTKTDVINSLGIPSSSTLFCVELNIVCAGVSGYNVTLFGRTTIVSGANTSEYPYMRDKNYGNVNTGRTMSAGNVVTYILAYNGITYDAYLKSSNY